MHTYTIIELSLAYKVRVPLIELRLFILILLMKGEGSNEPS